MFKIIISQLTKVIPILFDSIPFIVKHKLWSGFFKEKVILILSVIAAILIPLGIYDYFSEADNGQLGKGVYDKLIQLTGKESLWEAVSDGSQGYVIIILLSMLITFFGNKTMEVLTGDKVPLTFKNYIVSQLRVFVLSIRNLVLQKLISIPLAIVIGLFFPDWLGEIAVFMISGFFAGYIFLDAYFEIFRIKIKSAVPIINSNYAASSVIGMVALTLFNIPLIGGVIASFVCTVAATRYLHYGKNWDK
jgi:hypothetical protein